MQPEIEQALRFCPTLPSLSGVALRIVELSQNPDVRVADIAAVLRNDPALTAKVLRVANSPLYRGHRRTVTSLRQATMVLGLDGLITLALSFSLAATLRTVPAPGLDRDCFWRRSLLAALAAQLLSEELGLPSPEEAFLAALLQDLGILALATALPTRYGAVLAGVRSHDELLRRERELLGTDHGEACAWLLRHWGLPEYLALAATTGHQDIAVPEEAAARDPFAFCVAASGVLAERLLAPEAASTGADALPLAWAAPLLARLAEAVPTMEPLFEVQLVSAEQLLGLADQARELLALRHLHLLQAGRFERSQAQQVAQEHAQLSDAAHRDELTGLHNRRYLNRILKNEFAQAEALGSPLGLAFIDLDHFKTVNDSHGHQAGDAVLVTVAQTLQAQLRAGDHVVRYGGEEFVVVLPGAEPAAMQQVLERVRRAIAALACPLEDGGVVRVTASAGYAVHRPGGSGFATAAALVRAADQALYRAKRAGRNQVADADTPA